MLAIDENGCKKELETFLTERNVEIPNIKQSVVLDFYFF